MAVQRAFTRLMVVVSALSPVCGFAAESHPAAHAQKPYLVIERGPVRAVIINNDPVNDSVLPAHRGGYSGLALLEHRNRADNVFVPFYSGLNFEHIHDGTTREQDILFEPRRAPMEIRRLGEFAIELLQPPTPHWKLESRLHYEILENGALELRFECIPRERTFRNGYIGLFFASYINRPHSPAVNFIGCPAAQPDCSPAWVNAVSPSHGELAAHLALSDTRIFTHDANFPLSLVFNHSQYRFAEPWYYGVTDGMALVFIFRNSDCVRFSQSPSGGGSGNPAWDFQWFIADYEVGKTYRFVMRLLYVPFESPDQIARLAAPHLAHLNAP